MSYSVYGTQGGDQRQGHFEQCQLRGRVDASNGIDMVNYAIL